MAQFESLLLLSLLVALSSCRIQNLVRLEGGLGGLISEMKTIQEASPGLIVRAMEDICHIPYREAKVVAINGHQLKSCLSKETEAIVYL